MKKTYCDICEKEKEVDELLGASPVASEVEIGESVIVIELRQKIKPPQDICLECAGKAIYDKFCGISWASIAAIGGEGQIDAITIEKANALRECSRSAKTALDLALDEIEKV